MLTVVFISHGPSILRAWLLDSLRRREAKYELILIDDIVRLARERARPSSACLGASSRRQALR